MTPLFFVLLVYISGAFGSAALFRHVKWASLFGTFCASSGSLIGFVVAARALASGMTVDRMELPWSLPNASFIVGIDPLTSFFLVPLFLLGAITSIYGHHYLDEERPRFRRGIAFVTMNVLMASMVLLLVARHAVLFLMAWETMSLAAYFLFTYEHESLEVRKAGFIYLVVAHLGVACLIALFLLLRVPSGSFAFELIASTPVGYAFAATALGLAVIGFGIKAGLLPFHVWLPQAHAAAPSHVSAFMSGVLIKMGIYGILRVGLLIGAARPFFGAALLCLGALTAVFGISIAAYQRDFKRVLAYSSVENMGLVTLGIGLGFWGRSSGHPLVAAAGTVGALLHVYNHTAMKGLLFLLSGNVLHACHTKDLERLGGLGKRMPMTFALLVVGALAIAGLPPLNAFVSEWLLYTGLMRGALVGSGAGAVACVMAVAMLSFIGAIAALCFIRLVGTSMLGEPRTENASSAKESAIGLWLPAVPLGLIVIAQGLAPDRVLGWIHHVVGQLLGSNGLDSVSSLGLGTIARVNRMTFGVLLFAVIAVQLVFGTRRIRGTVPTWDCGYVAPTARMQYTARGISELFTEIVLPRRLVPKVSRRLPVGVLPTSGHLEGETSDPLTRDAYGPFVTRWANRFARLRWMQQGHLHIYLLYILMTLIVALAFSAIHSG
ncbi:MAG: proton-conducting transporter membrane subunit [Polyangiaceae bacterium]